MRHILIAKSRMVLGLLALLALANIARSEDSNRDQVRTNIEKDGWSVVWGKNFTEGDWVDGTTSIAESVAADNPAPFLRWFNQTLAENFTKIERNLEGVTRQDLNRWIVQSLKEKKIVTFKGFQIDAGFATYNRWQRTVVEVPDGIETQGIKSKIRMKKVENTIPLPNWNQFYIRYKLTRAGNDAGSRNAIAVTFTNDAPYGVDFSLNGSGPISQPIRLERGQAQTFNLKLATGFDPYIRLRQPDASFQNFSLPLRDQRYRIRRTPQNRVVNVAE